MAHGLFHQVWRWRRRPAAAGGPEQPAAGGFGTAGLALAALRKEQVYELARCLGVRASVREKRPSAGLWVGQTDEEEMGVSYADIDRFLRGEPVSAAARERIDFWHNRSHHKRQLAPVPQPPEA